MKLQFITSAADPHGWPPPAKPEIALAGRSNAGKSSFLNALGGSNKIAKVSQVPGKTRLLNFFEAGEHYRLVDMPGYGFSKRSGDEQSTWGDLVESYVSGRENLVGVLLLMDIRREWTQDEQQILDFVQSHGRRVAVALTKVDSVSRNEAQKLKSKMQKESGERDVFMTSIRDAKSVQAVEDFMFRQWVKGL
ncbi:MAG: ribosome biogenesis GTP-binding protein YihA/YsxC [Bdellovibrionales bacterium]